MITQDNYTYASKLLYSGSALFFILFFLYHSISTNSKKVNITQALLTISISLMILGFITKNAIEQKELDSPLFYFTFILGIPLLYHLLYLTFFSEDTETKMKIVKIYILFGIMIYLSLIWYNTKNIINSERINTNCIDIIKILTLY